MPREDSDWLHSGNGSPPAQTWAFATDAPLADVQFARETGDTLAADVLGGLYRLDRRGRVQLMTRGFKQLRILAWSETGTDGAAVLGKSEICRFDRQLQIRWTMQLPGTIHAVAMDPFGQYIAAALDTSETLIIGENKRRVCEFDSFRPLHFLRFVMTEPALIGSADYGLLQRQQFDGEPVWDEKLWNTVGDLAITGDGRHVFLASYSHGIQVYDGEGCPFASYVLKGSPSRLSTSVDGSAIIVATQENYLYRMNPQGHLHWAAEAPDPVVRVHADPLGQSFVCGFDTGRVVRFDWPR